jgi:hypothetical protein
MNDYEDLKPGTAEAVANGCICVRNQSGPPEPYLCDGNCPIHGIAELAAYLRNPNEPRPQEQGSLA